MTTTFKKRGSLYYDGIHWYRPVIHNGTTILERVEDGETLKEPAEEVKDNDEVSN